MNRHFFYSSWLILFTTLIFSLNAWALPVEIESSSKIRNVVVFTQSAMIKKEARFPVKKGENDGIIAIMQGITTESISPERIDLFFKYLRSF